jgi:membrane protein implicated in regulation of membrane protease activity
MQVLFLIIFIGILFATITIISVVIGYSIAFLICLGASVLLGFVIFSLLGLPGVYGAIILAILLPLSLIFSKTYSKGKRRKTSKEEKEYREWQKLDEELEDYDYLDDMTGREDKNPSS